jgi:hypothetical protein
MRGPSARPFEGAQPLSGGAVMLNRIPTLPTDVVAGGFVIISGEVA